MCFIDLVIIPLNIVLNAFVHPSFTLGLLEKPNLPPAAPNVTYKLFMFGKASSGKTWTMNRLSGQEVSAFVNYLLFGDKKRTSSEKVFYYTTR